MGTKATHRVPADARGHTSSSSDHNGLPHITLVATGAGIFFASIAQLLNFGGAAAVVMALLGLVVGYYVARE